MRDRFHIFYFNKIQTLRIISLFIFSVLAIYSGIEFHLFLKSLSYGEFSPRPPAADAFLPISSLMNVRYFTLSGYIHRAHPAGFFILISAVLVSWLFSKSFCGWVCPFGFLSEILLNIRKIIIKKDFNLPAWADYPLRALKYVLLFFFVFVIFISMDAASLRSFLDSDYNIISDVKMYYFFADITPFALSVIAVLFVLTFFFNFFWCRYLCPYGALMALSGILSPFRIKREITECSGCEACHRACPHNIRTDKIKTVLSDDCSSCLMCISSCSKSKALSLSPVFSRKKISPLWVPLAVFGIFLVLRILAGFNGLWQNEIGPGEYRALVSRMGSLTHPGKF